MSSKISLTIDEDLLDALGQIVPGEKTYLSIFNVPQNEATNDKMARLKSSGIITVNGAVKQAYSQMLDTLAKARTVSSLKYSAGNRLYEFIVHFPTIQNLPSVSVLHDNKKLVIETPASVESAFSLIDQNMGHSNAVSSNFSSNFTRNEAAAVLALMDLFRSAALHALADELELKNPSFELPAVISKATNPSESLQSLVAILQLSLEQSKPPNSTEVTDALKSLLEKNIVIQTNSKYRLNDKLQHFASRLLVIDNLIRVEAGRIDATNKLAYANFTAAQAGVNDIIYIENRDQDLLVRSASGMQIVGLAAKFLNEPNAIIKTSLEKPPS